MIQFARLARAFLKSPLGRYTIAALVILALFTATYLTGLHNGKSSERAAEARRLEQARKTVAKREVKASAITQKVGEKLTQERVKIEYRTRYLTREVPVYVTQASDAACVVPSGFVLLYNAAASGSPASLPSAPGGSVEEPSGVPLSGVLETDVWNLGLGHDFRAEALAWREWYAKQAEAWNR